MQHHEAQLDRLCQRRPCCPENTNQVCATDKLMPLVCSILAKFYIQFEPQTETTVTIMTSGSILLYQCCRPCQ